MLSEEPFSRLCCVVSAVDYVSTRSLTVRFWSYFRRFATGAPSCSLLSSCHWRRKDSETGVIEVEFVMINVAIARDRTREDDDDGKTIGDEERRSCCWWEEKYYCLRTDQVTKNHFVTFTLLSPTMKQFIHFLAILIVSQSIFCFQQFLFSSCHQFSLHRRRRPCRRLSLVAASALLFTKYSKWYSWTA